MERKEIDVKNLIVICHILDKYNEFSKNIGNLIANLYDANDIYIY